MLDRARALGKLCAGVPDLLLRIARCTVAKHLTNSQSDEFPAAAARTAAAAPTAALGTVDLTPLIGEWKCCDSLYGGIIKVLVKESAGNLFVHAFGRCHPSPCDWGEVKGQGYADTPAGGPAVGFHAIYSFSFKDTIVTAMLDRRILIVRD